MMREHQILFPPFRLDLGTLRLWREDAEVFLRPKSAAVLRTLVQHHGRFMSKQELLEAVWAETCVSDGALKVCIRELRKTLGDDARTPQFIETVHRRGYRFFAPISTPVSQVSTSPVHHFVAANGIQSVSAGCNRHRQDLLVCLGLVKPLIAHYGEAAPQVEETFTKAWELCQRVEDSTLQFHTLLGLGVTRLVRGDLAHAHAVAQQAMGIAQGAENSELAVAAHHVLGMTCFYHGDLVQARDHMDHALAYASTSTHPAMREARVIGLSQAANVLWMMGYPDQALQHSEEAVTLAKTLQHPHTLAFALCYAALLHVACGREETMQQYADEALTVARRYELSLWHALATMANGWVLTERGQAKAGLPFLQEGLAAYRATGAAMALPNLLAMVVSAATKAGHYEDAWSALNEALHRVEHTQEKVFASWLYQLKGELIQQKESKVQNLKSKAADPRLLIPDPQGEAEVWCLKAISTARNQQAKSLELRAVISLARHRQQSALQQGAASTEQKSRLTRSLSRKGPTKEYRMLLMLYNRFTEGFTTRDLQEAKALLAALA